MPAICFLLAAQPETQDQFSTTNAKYLYYTSNKETVIFHKMWYFIHLTVCTRSNDFLSECVSYMYHQVLMIYS